MPQIDPFQSHQRGLSSPASRHFPITPADDVDLPLRPRVLRILSTGTVTLRDETGQRLTYPVQAGEVMMFSPVGIEASGTTVDLVGWL